MKQHLLLLITSLCYLTSFSQQNDIAFKAQKDSSLKALIHADSLKIEKEFAEIAKWNKIATTAQFPIFSAGLYSGVIPVKEPTEIPDSKLDYKLLFELTVNNPDSLLKEINIGLVEVARIINLHVASGIAGGKIIPVLVLHGGGLNAIINNDSYVKKFKVDNPNLKLIAELDKFGAKFIACGQALALMNINKETLLPIVKVSLTAKTVISSYQLKGFVLYNLSDVGK
ncbi:MAG: DsrE family protein [Ferruginibacter sp.]